MRLSKYILTLLFLAGVFAAQAQQQGTSYSLQQCVAIAIKNNLTVQQDSLTAQQNRIGFLQSEENLLPNISGTASRSIANGRSLSTSGLYTNSSQTTDNYGVNGSITLFNGLALQKAIKQASLQYQAGKMTFQAAKDIVTINIITNYLQVLDAKDVLNQDTSQLAVARENLARSETLEQQGANKFASDVYDLRGSFQGAKVNLAAGQAALSSAMLNLFQLMNIPFDPKATLQPLNAEDLKGDNGVNPEDVYNTALGSLAQIKAATFARQSAEKQVGYYRGLLWPQLYLGGNLSTVYSNRPGATGAPADPYGTQLRNNYGTNISLGLNVPIFTNLYRRNNVAIAKINLQNQQFIENNVKVQVRQNIAQAYYNMVSAYTRYQALKDEVEAYTESFRISKARYEAGVLTSVDFVTSKNNMDNANLAFISARYDYIIYSKILDYYQGKLL